jgi:hypothetical protein
MFAQCHATLELAIEAMIVPASITSELYACTAASVYVMTTIVTTYPVKSIPTTLRMLLFSGKNSQNI